MTDKRSPVAILVSRFPSAAESFLVRELDALERRGVPFVLVAIVRGRLEDHDEATQRWMRRAVVFPWISLAIFRAMWNQPGTIFPLLGWVLSNAMLQPRTLVKSLAVFGMAAHAAERLPAMGVRHVHAHFATHATTMAMIVSRLSRIPFSFTAHAHAIFVSRALLREKVREAAFVRTISEFNRRFLESLYPSEAAKGKLCVVRVGAMPLRGNDRRTQRRGNGTIRIACLAALKAHKGIPVLVEACCMLADEGVDFFCDIVGSGPLRAEIEDDIAASGVADLIRLRPHGYEDEALRDADIVVQPSVIAQNGQMDGIPVPLIDAMAAGKAVIASAISGIPELVANGETGLLVDPANPRLLAAAIARLADDPALRARLAVRAREKVAADFCLEKAAAELETLFFEAAS